MIPHQFSKRFKKNTDPEFKQAEFEQSLAEFMQGFVDCYPHLVEKKSFDDDSEDWIFKFNIDPK